MAQQFGKTWWGEQFLKALTDIDHSNRLPRGRTYARNGSVASIDIIKNKIEAKVKGSRPRPYKSEITLPLFTNAEKKKLIQVISEDPLLLSHLLNRELPQELNEIALKHNIAVFPSKWSDFNMECSCPDWAVPCKHLAAVIYMISAEIDRNPFLIFELHGLDIFQELTKNGMVLEKEIEIPTFKQLLQDQPAKNQEDTTETNQQVTFDLSKITPQTEKLLSLLAPKSIFYEKPFVVLLRKSYKAVARYVKTLTARQVEELKSKDFESIEAIELFMDENGIFQKAIFHSDQGESVYEASSNGLETLLDFLKKLPKKYKQRFSNDLRTLYKAFHLSLKLAENGAFMPQMLALQKNVKMIRWIPAIINEEVNDLLNTLELAISSELVKVSIDEKKYQYLSLREQSITLISIFLTHFVKINTWFWDGNMQHLDTKIEQLFFKNECHSFNKLGEKQIPEAIHQYLQRFYMGEKPFVPLIKIEDHPDKNTFEFQLWVENRKDSMQKPISLVDFINKKAYHNHKTSLFQSLASLSHDFSAIKPLISSSGKERLFVDSDTFADVLLHVLPVVKLLGIRILLPNSLKSLARPKISLKLESNSSSSSVKGYLKLDEMLQFEWQVAIGDKTIRVDEFKKLVAGTSGVVNIKGAYVLIDQKEVATMLANLDAEKQLSHAELLQSALTEEYQEAKISISKAAKQLIRELLQGEAIATPKGLNAKLRPYQERGYQWLYNNSKVGFGSIIADDMGLGKTLQVISLLLKFKSEGRFKDKKALVVVPTTLITNWKKEIEKFAPALCPYIYHGTKREFTTNHFDLMITSYGMLRSDASKFHKVTWELLAIDEAQNIKNPSTAQTKAVKKLKATVKIAMSGTPVENRLSEYWSLFDFINKGYLGSAKFFKKEFATPIEGENNELQLNRFKKITEPFMLRRLKTDKSIISDLPDKVEHDCFVELTKEQTALYQNVVNTMIKALGDTDEGSIERKGLVLNMITALKQVCNHPSQFLKKEDDRVELSGKTALLIELLRSIHENDEKVLIFSQYKEMGQILVRILKNVFDSKPLFLHGGVSRKKRDEMVEEFQTKKHQKIFILSIKAGGTGLNLTAANHVIHYDLWWNPAVEAQATDRAFRIGQQKNVLVHRMISKGTFEEKINEMLLDKKHLADLTVSAGEKWIGDLSNTELKELVGMGN